MTYQRGVLPYIEWPNYKKHNVFHSMLHLFHVVTFSDSERSVLPTVQSGAISLLPFITIAILDLQYPLSILYL